MKKIAFNEVKHFILGILLIALISITNSLVGYADGNIQGVAFDNQLELFVPATGAEISKAYVQIGNSSKIEAEVQNIDSSDSVISTTILFDNSNSISDANRPKMKELTKQIIERMVPREQISLSTFDTDKRVLLGETTDKAALINAVDSIQFSELETYLTDVIYGTLKQMSSITSNTFRRLIILSDGGDDNDAGYLYEELYDLIDQTDCQVISAGSLYKGNPDAEEKMFSISRRSDSPYFSLDDTEDMAAAAEQINSSLPSNIVTAEIPEAMRDGSRKNVLLTIDYGQTTAEYPIEIDMPFNNSPQPISESEEVETTSEKATEVVETESEKITEAMTETEAEVLPPWESQETEKSTKESSPQITIGGLSINYPTLYIAGSVAVALVIILGILAWRRKKSSRKTSVEEYEDGTEHYSKTLGYNAPEDDDSEATEIREEDASLEEEDDDERTLLVSGTIGNNNTQSVFVTLEDSQNPDRVFSSAIYDEIMIGRSSECDIVITEDKAIGRKQCKISKIDGKYYLRDNNSSNGTALNGQKISAPEEISSGDLLEIGRSHFIIKISRS